jgi:penicillin G amidase
MLRSLPAAVQNGPMEAFRDQFGVPHVRAASVGEAFYAQGYLSALDRGLQMEYERRRALGRWAEVVGEKSVSDDLFARRVGLTAASRRSYDALDPQTRAVLTAYADGVNAVLADVLRDTDVPSPIEPWEPWHCCAVYLGRHVGMGSMAHKLFRTATLPTASADLVWRVRPNAQRGIVVTPPGSQYESDAAGPPDDYRDVLCRWLGDLTDVETVSASADPAAGSNNWVVSGTRTASGLPLLAGDPHRPLETPSPYWRNHVACDEFDAIGLSFPGVPGFPHFGHNEHVAWSITHGMADDQDLFIEELSELTTRAETVSVRDGDAVEVTVFEGPRGGVIVQDGTAKLGLALQWTGFVEPDRTLDCLLPMLRARSAADLDASMRGWTVPVDHMMMADTAGSIGYRLRGRVPLRHEANTWAAVPGGDPAFAWDGWVPFEEMPAAADPPEGFLASANNRPVGAESPFVANDFAGPARASRIVQLLQEGERFDRAAMEEIHADVVSLTAREFVASLDGVGDDPTPGLLKTLRDWDGAMELGSVAATVYTEVRRELLTVVPLIEASQTHAQLLSHAQRTGALWLAFPALLAGARDGDVSVFGDWPEAVRTALDRAYRRVCAELGPDVSTWTWGRLHQARFSAIVPGVTPVSGRPLPGDNETVRAAGLHGVDTTVATSGSVARYVFDLADWENCGWVVPERTEQWYAARLDPMHYAWPVIESVSERVPLS